MGMVLASSTPMTRRLTILRSTVPRLSCEAGPLAGLRKSTQEEGKAQRGMVRPLCTEGQCPPKSPSQGVWTAPQYPALEPTWSLHAKPSKAVGLDQTWWCPQPIRGAPQVLLAPAIPPCSILANCHVCPGVHKHPHPGGSR